MREYKRSACLDLALAYRAMCKAWDIEEDKSYVEQISTNLLIFGRLLSFFEPLVKTWLEEEMLSEHSDFFPFFSLQHPSKSTGKFLRLMSLNIPKANDLWWKLEQVLKTTEELFFLHKISEAVREQESPTAIASTPGLNTLLTSTPTIMTTPPHMPQKTTKHVKSLALTSPITIKRTRPIEKVDLAAKTHPYLDAFYYSLAKILRKFGENLFESFIVEFPAKRRMAF